eukprot:GEMP01091604.1.p1 GENE.GEMP01091604.1~~GEMP01091604.1.p1  ORF type:complete len:108 (-),score=1.13 GEMP01091604.1:459-782(-)
MGPDRRSCFFVARSFYYGFLEKVTPNNKTSNIKKTRQKHDKKTGCGKIFPPPPHVLKCENQTKKDRGASLQKIKINEGGGRAFLEVRAFLFFAHKNKVVRNFIIEEP